MGIAVIFFILLAGLFSVAAVTSWLERHVYVSIFMAMTSIVLIGTVAMAMA